MQDEIAFPTVIMPTRYDFHLAPSNIDLAGAEIEHRGQSVLGDRSGRIVTTVTDHDIPLIGCCQIDVIGAGRRDNNQLQLIRALQG